jgi:predicted O-methyltransferase YrrM
LNFFSLFKRNIIYKFKKKALIDKDGVKNFSLDELFHYYGSDKADIFKKTDSKGHGYSSFYLKNLNNLKDSKINILEIGSYAGASAAAFAKFFPNSNIFCFDVNITNFKFQSKKIHVYGLDINNKEKVDKILKNIFEIHQFNSFDVIIDDGSHYLSDILHSLNFFFKYLKKNGFFVIEDFKHPNYYEYNKNIEHIFIDDFLKNILNKRLSTSTIFSNGEQEYLMNSIKKIDIEKGNLKDSDICFIKKK